MAEKCTSTSLLGVMDHLWFHQIILFSLEKPLPIQESITCSPKNHPQEATLIPQEEISSLTFESTPLQVVCEANEKESPQKERPTRLNLITTRNRSHSSSPFTEKKQTRNAKFLESGKRVLEKTMSLGELELEEVKGFMDLGFIFDKEHINKRMIRVIPGLQRLEVISKDEENNEDSDNDVAEEDEVKKEIVRPYLSEAWLIKKPDSPLLNLKIPRISAAPDMKKHLKYWAKTVATVIQQES